MQCVKDFPDYVRALLSCASKRVGDLFHLTVGIPVLTAHDLISFTATSGMTERLCLAVLQFSLHWPANRCTFGVCECPRPANALALLGLAVRAPVVHAAHLHAAMTCYSPSIFRKCVQSWAMKKRVLLSPKGEE